MAYVLSQLPVHCSPVELLKEPDVIPTFKYFFERELPVHVGSTKSEDQNTTSNNSVQLEADVDEVIDVVTCEDHNTASDSSAQLKVGVDEVIDVTCEDHNTKSDSSLQLTLDKDEVINVVTCEDSTETVLLPNVAGASLKRKPEMKEFTIPMKKLRVAKNCLNKKIELEEDEYIFCSKCDKLQIGACSIHCSLQWMREPSTVLVTEGLTKARSTIPDNMELKSSSIPDAGLGIFSKERFESDVVFGPYWGQKIGVADVSPNMDQGYMWDIIENGQVTHVVDARDESHSNWLRFVNCARNDDEQNLVAFQYRGKIYYRSYKVIEPGMELLVWYGDRYACDLDILDKDNKPADGPIQCQKCFMVCWGPNSLASHNKFRCQMNNENHLWRCMHCDRSFKTQSSLHFHKNIHKGLKPFPCKICGKVFSYPQSRRRHYNQHFGREPVSCKMCRKVFIDKIGLRVHIRKYHNHQDLSIQANKCQYCGQSFTSGVGLSNHMRIHETTNSQNFCSICKVTFGYSFTFAKHMQRKHPGVKVLRCGKCGKACADKRRLALHVAIKHSRKHGTGSSLQQVKENRSLQHSKKRVSPCNKCKQTLPRNKFHNHMCIQQHTNVNTVGEQGVDSKKPVNSSGKKRENSVNLPKDRFVGQNNAIKCEFCFKCFPTLNLMYHHRAAHFRKNNPALPASVAEQRVVGKKPGNSSDQKHEDSPSLLKDRLVGQNTTVRCEFCLKGFPTSHLMHRHRAAHFRKSNPTFPIAASIRPTVPPSGRLDHAEHSSKEIRCKVCCKKFPSLEKLQCHRAIHFSGIGKFCCTICGRSFKTKRSLGSHKTHHSINRRASGSCDGSFRCEICSKSFPTERSLRSHKSHHGRPRGDGDALLSPSPKRPQETKGSQGVDAGSKELFGRNVHKKHLPSSLSVKEPQHRSSNHPSNESAFSSSEHKLFRCEVCGKKFRVKATLQRHKGHHTRAKHFRTHQFAKANFKSKSSVGGNVPKPYECNTCLESFCSRGSLLVHKRRADHGMNATLICPFCDQTFSSKDNLLVHKQQLHSTADPFMCFCCNAQFSTKYARNKHVIVCRVEEEKRETTVNPEASFKSSPTVDESCQEPHVCNICFESFQSIRSLSVHKRSHAGISTPFVCSICHRGLSSKRSLLRHKRSQHSTTSLHCKDKLAAKRNRSNHSCITQMKTTKCHLCSEAFLTTPGLLKHLALKHGIGESVQKNSSSPKTHQQKSDALGVSPFSCLPCNKRFLSYNGLYKHNRNHHSERKHDSAQTVQSSVDADLDDQQGCKPESTDKGIRQFACLPCNKRFLSYSGLYRHDRKRHAKSKSDAAKRVKINLDEQGLERNETNNYRRWKCQYCEKEFQSYSGFNKHDRKKHRKKKRLDRRQGCKADAKGINRPFKCQYCEKQFWTNSGMKKHVWRKHPTCKKKIIDNQQGYKPEVKANIDASSSETIKATLTCHHCKISGSQSSRLNCCRCNTELSVQSRISLDSSPSMESSKPTMRAFRCQYCLKGFSTINSRYKHIVIAHGTELISIPPAPRKTLGNGHNNTINAASLAGQSKEAVQNCQKVHGSASDDNHQLQEASYKKSKPIKKVMRGRTKCLRFTFSCWYCRRSFLSNASRRKHELIVHGQRVGFSSALLKCNNGKIYKGKLSGNTAILSEEQLPAGQNRQGEPLASSSTDGSHAKMVSDSKLPPTSKAFPCQYCPRQFFSVSGRYKHVALAHSEKASSSSKVCQLHPKVPNEFNVSSVSPAKRAKPLSINSGEPLSKRSKPKEMGPVIGLTLQNDITSGCRDAVSSSSKQTLTRIKAFQCKYCTKSFSACSLRYKHFLLVHSRSRALAEQGSVDQEMCFVDKPSQASLPHATSNDSVSIVKPITSSFVSQSKIREPNRLSVPDNCSKVVSVFDEDLEPYTCRICSKFFRTKSDWVAHFKEEHNNAGKAMSGIRSPSRPALRTISPAFHNNSLKPLRNRRKTRTKAKHGNQLSSLCERNVAKPKSSVCPLGTKANIPDKRAQCDICLLLFSTRDSVSRHKKTKHCDERPFQCHFCGFAAKRSDHISSHERYHCKGRI